jgi:hypothetical protein
VVYSEIFIVIALLVLAILAIFFVFIKRNKPKPPSRIAFIAMFLIIAGILFGEDPFIGYGLLGAGIVLRVIDILISLLKKGLIAEEFVSWRNWEIDDMDGSVLFRIFLRFFNI